MENSPIDDKEGFNAEGGALENKNEKNYFRNEANFVEDGVICNLAETHYLVHGTIGATN